MDIPETKNKAMDGSASVNKSADSATSIKAVSGLMNDYFFPGGGIWKPMTVRASTREEAEQTHKQRREPVSPAETEKVEESKESNNQ